MVNKLSSVNIRLRSIAVGGDAVGEVKSISAQDNELLGITAFVPFGIPGEEVSAVITEKRPKFIKAQITEIIESSPDRVEPLCKFYKECGGCELQHIDYASQLRFKKEMVIGALRSSKLPLSILNKVPDLISSVPYYYRRRIHLHLNAQGHVGFYQASSRTIVQIDSCVIADKALQSSIVELRKISKLIAGKINSVHLETSENKVVSSFVAPYELSNAEIKLVAESIRSSFGDFVIISAGKNVWNEGQSSQRLPLTKSNSVYIRIPSGGFSQVNWGMNLNLISSVTNFFLNKDLSRIFDLYAGAGNFALALAKDNHQVTAVETEPKLVSLAREVAKDQGFLKNITYHELSVDKFVKNLNLLKNEKVGVIADPPRSGLGVLTNSLKFADCIALVSCHLPSFVRDLKSFIDLGYELEKIELFDMFPQTTYLESVAFLKKV